MTSRLNLGYWEKVHKKVADIKRAEFAAAASLRCEQEEVAGEGQVGSTKADGKAGTLEGGIDR